MKRKSNLRNYQYRLVNQLWKIFRRATIVALLFLLNLYGTSFDVRALWVVRDHITNPDKIDEVIEFAKEHNFNHLFVQIRGRGDAYYNSMLVPRSHLLKNTDFDPLDYFIKETKKSGIKIHAWMNVYYLWSSHQRPSQNKHVLLNHPEWLDTKEPDEMNVSLMLDKMGSDRKINGEGFYLAPTHPEVEAHLQNIITELLQNYRLDGIHFDYIRYHDIGYGMNQTGLKFFLSYTSGIPGLSTMGIQSKPSFSDYKKSAITNFVKNASMRIKAYQPDCIISAAVKPNIDNAKNTFGQEWDLWLTSGYIDWAVPMNYTRDNKVFEDNLMIMQNSLSSKYINRIIMGIGAYNQKYRLAGQKIYRVGKNDFGGISIFSYTVFKEDSNYAKQLKKYLN